MCRIKMVSKMVKLFLVVLMSVCESRHHDQAPPNPPLNYWAVAKRGLCPDGGGDKNAACGYWKKSDYCEPDNDYADFMAKTCPASCGLCEARPTSAPEASTVNVNIRECLRAHNSKRAMHRATPLTWDRSLAIEAQAWAIKIANNGKMKHAPWSGAGENLYFTSNTAGRVGNCKEAVEAWYGEVSDYSFRHPPKDIWDVPFGVQIGHFTQVVWKSTRKVGVAIATIKRRGFWTQTYVVARYSPPGNVYGKLGQQVGNSIMALK